MKEKMCSLTVILIFIKEHMTEEVGMGIFANLNRMGWVLGGK